MKSLTEFLLARIAEDEARARLPLAVDRAHAAGCEYITVADHFTPECDCNMSARVLAECEAKRRIVEVHAHHARWDDTNIGEWARATLQLLALPYADHPDYCEEWRP